MAVEQLAKCELCGWYRFRVCRMHKRRFSFTVVWCHCRAVYTSTSGIERRLLLPPLQLPSARFPGEARRHAQIVGDYIRKSLAALNVEGHSGALPGDKVSGQYPALWEFLTDGGPDPATGEVRETATLLIFRDQEVLKACLNDRETGRQLFVSASGLGGIFAAVEAAVRSDQPDWRMKGCGKAGRRPGK